MSDALSLLLVLSFLGLVLLVRRLASRKRSAGRALFAPEVQPVDGAQAAGVEGERAVMEVFHRMGVPFLHHVYLLRPDETPETEIDLLVFLATAIVVVEVKAWGGVIEGGKGDRHWVQSDRSGREIQRQNPLRQNQGHIAQLRRRFCRARFINLVVFAGRGSLPEERDPHVLLLEQLPGWINEVRQKGWMSEPDGPTLYAWARLSALSSAQDKPGLAPLHVARIEADQVVRAGEVEDAVGEMA